MMSTSDHPPVLRTANEAQAVALVGDVYRYLVTGAETGGKYATFEAFVGPGGGPPPHIHRREEESFFVLEGEITFTVNGERIVAGSGTFASVPIGSLHSFKNETARAARMLITMVPAGLEQMFLEVGILLPPGSMTAPPPSAEQVARLLAAAPKYGVEFPSDSAAGAGSTS
jgi:quercetin dioxygenase-like cupin family protein